MRLSTALTLLGAALSQARNAQASSSLSREEVNTIIRSAATADESIEYRAVTVGPFTTSGSFEAEIQEQWAINSQLGEDVSAPYLVCDHAPGNGYSRMQNINSECDISVGDSIVQNLDDRTCFDAQLLYEDAHSCATESYSISVLPRTPWTKISYNALSSSVNFGESFNVTQPDKVNVGKARYSAEFCGDEPELENARKRTAKDGLKKVHKGTPECKGDKLIDDFTFTLGNSILKLYQKEDVSVNYACMLALLHSLAGNPFVCDVGFDPEITTHNRDGRWIIQGSVYDDSSQMSLPLHDAGITGEGMVAQISDTGLSVNSCYFYDSEGEVPRDKSAVVDTNRRKVIQYYAKEGSTDSDGHGTHCAGTILGKICTGNGCSPSSSNQDGIAPGAKLAVYDVDNYGYIYPDTADPMFTRGIAAGAYVHSASWGNGINSYQSRDKDFDKFMYENPDFVEVHSAGNDGSYNSKNRSSSVGKNNVSVCATMNKGQGQGELYAAYFSSMGPSYDGRIKPDICAPGMVIQSADNGSSRQCGSVGYSGTSMSCPGVAGAVLLIRQYFMEGFYPSGTKVPSDGFTPSGALIKGVILNSGRAMLGRDGSSNFPSEPYDESQGFGLISLVDGLYLEGKSKGKVLVYDKVEISNGQEWEETFILDECPAEHTSVTLNYYDKENSSTSCDPCIVNRLELTLEKGVQTFYPNGRTTADTKNNAQRIRIPKDQESITVKVTAANLATENQEFSIVISGCVDIGTKRPTKSPAPTPIPTESPSLAPTKSPAPTTKPSKTPSLLPSMLPSSSPTCFEDPDAEGADGRNCAWLGEDEYRMKNYCDTEFEGQLVKEVCCETCKQICNAQEIFMDEYYSYNGGQTFDLPEIVNNVWQIQGRLRCLYTSEYYTSGDYILLDKDNNELAKLNIHCGGYHGTDVTKKSSVFEEVVMGVAKVRFASYWNPGYNSELVSLCDDKGIELITV